MADVLPTNTTPNGYIDRAQAAEASARWHLDRAMEEWDAGRQALAATELRQAAGFLERADAEYGHFRLAQEVRRES